MKTNSNGPKAFAGVVLIAAVIAGVYAMVEPMSQRIDFLERQLAKTESTLVRIDDRARDSLSILHAIPERFQEVETQFASERQLRTKNEVRSDRDREEFLMRLRELEKIVWVEGGE